MEQVFTPKLNTAAKPGWCLQYIDDGGDVPSSVPPRTGTAKKAYDNEKNASRVRFDNLPDNIWVVGWLDFTKGMYTAEGHVFFIKRSGTTYEIHDSEVHSRQRHPYKSIEELLAWFGAYKPIYIGWSTNCDGRQYAKEKDMALRDTIVADEVDNHLMFVSALKRAPYQDEKRRYIGKTYGFAVDDLGKNTDNIKGNNGKGGIYQMAVSYYENGSKIPDKATDKYEEVKETLYRKK